MYGAASIGPASAIVVTADNPVSALLASSGAAVVLGASLEHAVTAATAAATAIAAPLIARTYIMAGV